jgi:hypothetical protein
LASEPHPALCRSEAVLAAAVEGEKAVGMARVVGDRATAHDVHDVLVCPDRQRQGIGTPLKLDGSPASSE